ncbi:MAG TPA: hypothetical protein VKV40_17470 [Ktedonobacteraceae bacterium]|nr:hypothetical protein [Ktedonobacteraceae bacterium]
MSIDKHYRATSAPAHSNVRAIAATGPASSTGRSEEQRPRSGHSIRSVLLSPISPLWLCLLAALIIRVWLTVRTHGTLDGDEALLGIQAEHILRGERPIYFYGIPYFGSLEAYVAALIFAFFGPSVAALRGETTAFSLLLVAVTYWLASLLARAAHLPRYARRIFATVAALIAAIPPLYDGIVEMRTGGGWIETFILMLLLLVAAFRLTTRWHEGASNRELAARWAVIGFLVGFGMWIYPLISEAILAAGLWILIDRIVDLSQRIRTAEPLLTAMWRSLQGLLLAVVAIPACAIGFTPGIIWGAENNWANITFIRSLGGGWSIQRLHTVEKVASMYRTCVAPRIISGATPVESPLLQAIHSPLLLVGTFCIFATAALFIVSLLWPHPTFVQVRRLTALPVIFGVCTAVLYCTSSASASILISCTADFGGHYASTLALALPFFFATAFTLASMFLYEKSRKPLTDAPIPGRVDQSHLRSLPFVPAVAAPARRLSLAALIALGALLLAYLGGQAVTYGLTNADEAFQSAYCTIAPANYGPIITYMEQEHIHYAWATNLLGYQISFETDNRIILADPLPLIHPSIAINRIPAYTSAVKNADRPTLLVFVKHGDQHPYLLQALDAAHVTYRVAFFPSQPGVDVMVVTPLNRTVSPLTSKSLDIFYCAVH